MTASLFQLPDELILTALAQRFPCRETQIRTLATLVFPGAAPCQNLVIYGPEATGKSAVTAALLSQLADRDADGRPSIRYAIVNSVECITARHLYETVIGKVTEALEWDAAPSKCETVSQLTVELSKMLKYTPRPSDFRFVLVFDGIDRQRDAPQTLLPALARLSEIIPCLTTVFIATFPPPNFLRTSFVPHLHFPTYTKSEFIAILSASPPPQLPNTAGPQETAELWTRFAGAVHDALARAAARTLPSLRHACAALWPRFTAPILAGTHTAREFSKLLVAARVHFQDESLVDPGVVAPAAVAGAVAVAAPTSASTSSKPASQPPPLLQRKPPPVPATTTKTKTTTITTTTDLTTLLPPTARLLLLAAYLASHNQAKHDLVVFSTTYHRHRGRRRARSGGGVGGGVGVGGGRGKGKKQQHRKIARKLLGAHVFVLERMLAIFAAVRGEWEGVGGIHATAEEEEEEEDRQGGWGGWGDGRDADVSMAIATLASLRLLVRVGGGDLMDCGGKWRVNVGWEVVRALGRSVGVEVEDWLME